MTAVPESAWQHRRFSYYSSSARQIEEQAVLKVAFLIGSPAISGGTNVILQHAEFMIRHGVDVTIAAQDFEVDHEYWHPVLRSVSICSIESIETEFFDLVIATWWPTVFDLPRLHFRHALYFVQSIESRFYEADPDPRWSWAAEETYGFGLPMVTVASWIQAYLAFEHGAPSFLVLNGIDKGLFADSGATVTPRIEGRLRVLIEGHFDVPMKGIREALESCRLSKPDEVWYLSPGDAPVVSGIDKILSRVPLSEVASVYRSCDVLLKMSRVEGMFGPPLEMMHCGGTVVTWPSTGAEEYVSHMENGIITPMGDVDAAARGLRSLRENPQLLKELKAGAATTAMSWPTWADSSRRFFDVARLVAKRPAIGIEEMKWRIADSRSKQTVWRD